MNKTDDNDHNNNDDNNKTTSDNTVSFQHFMFVFAA